MAQYLFNRDGKKYLLDDTSGEVAELDSSEFTLTMVRRRKHRTTDFIIFEQQALAHLALMDLSSKEWCCLMYICSIAGFENRVYINQRLMAEALGLRESHVSTYIKSLRTRGLIYSHQAKGESRMFTISALVCWKGRVEQQAKRTTKEFT